MAHIIDESPAYGISGDMITLNAAQERDEAAHTISIWNSDKRGTGKRHIVAVGTASRIIDAEGERFIRTATDGYLFSGDTLLLKGDK